MRESEFPEDPAVIAAIVRPDPVELVQIGIPVLCQAVAVTLFLAACAVWIIIASTEVPA